jgi:N-acetylglucosamine kinase-like BadF-type ATPase
VHSRGEASTEQPLPSLNPASVRDPQASWSALIGAVAEEARTLTNGHSIQGCIASSSMSPETAREDEQRLRIAAAAVGLSGHVLLVNDAVALLLAPPLSGVGSVAVIGTGTVYWTRDAGGRVRRASGLDYVVSDEGGAFFIAQEALRAAARARDGRGPATSLLAAIEQHYDAPLPALARRLAGRGSIKSEVARFAPVVCRSATDGDDVAARILARACEAVVEGICAVVDSADAEHTLVLTGGVWSGCSYLSSRVTETLRARRPRLALRSVADCTSAALHLARFGSDLPLAEPAALVSVSLG